MNNLLLLFGAIVFLIILWIITYRNILNHFIKKMEKGEADLKAKLYSVHDKLAYLLQVLGENKAFNKINGVEVLGLRSQLYEEGKSPVQLLEIYKKISDNMQLLEGFDSKALHSDTGFLEISQELTDLNDEIRIVIKEYNHHVAEFNSQLIKFPGNFVGGLFKLQSVHELKG